MRKAAAMLAAGTVLAILVLCAVGCPNPAGEPTVYTSGFYSDGSGNYQPCYWIGTARSDLSLPIGADYGMAHAIVVDGGVLYAAGYYHDIDTARNVPCYWDGSGCHELDNDGVNNAYARGIFIDDGTVYTVGYYTDDGGFIRPCYWTGTTRTDLGLDASTNGWATSISVYGGTIYTAGYYGSPGTACYWTGSVKTDLPAFAGATDSVARSVFVSSGFPYIAGYYIVGGKAKACYWVVGGQKDTFPGYGAGDNVYAVSMCVSGSKLYTAGNCDTSTGDMSSCYWIDTTQTVISVAGTNEIELFGIDAANSVPYLCGYYYNLDTDRNIASYWQGSDLHELEGDPTVDSEALAICVVE